MIFDVLTEPWMGVVDKETGEVLKVGLRDYIVNAHMYKCSAESKDFAIVRRLQQRLAEAVIIDIYGRRVNDELMSVFNNGRFDADKIDAYFDECIKNGTSFDLFDEEKPFMQVDAKTAESVFKENSIASVSSINAKQCGGNNKVCLLHICIPFAPRRRGFLYGIKTYNICRQVCPSQEGMNPDGSVHEHVSHQVCLSPEGI